MFRLICRYLFINIINGLVVYEIRNYKKRFAYSFIIIIIIINSKNLDIFRNICLLYEYDLYSRYSRTFKTLLNIKQDIVMAV